jgi:Raf kinase inhibitor-like YbhB/YbcL family protein
MAHRLAPLAFAGCSLAISLIASLAQSDTGPQAITVSSPAFVNGGAIPSRYSCDADGKSPPLEWSTLPSGTRSVAVVVEDPDAPRGTFVHWVLFDLPAGTTKLTEDAASGPPAGAAQGKNGKGKTGWTAPCPPSGVHHYHFKVYALNQVIMLADPSEGDLVRAMTDHVLAQGETVGTYQRAKK